MEPAPSLDLGQRHPPYKIRLKTFLFQRLITRAGSGDPQSSLSCCSHYILKLLGGLSIVNWPLLLHFPFLTPCFFICHNCRAATFLAAIVSALYRSCLHSSPLSSHAWSEKIADVLPLMSLDVYFEKWSSFRLKKSELNWNVFSACVHLLSVAENSHGPVNVVVTYHWKTEMAWPSTTSLPLSADTSPR